jgi:hypothetical protein
VLERDVEERAARLGQHVVAPVAELCVYVDPPAAAVGHPGSQPERPVDRHGPPIADEDPRRHGREAVPRREETARLVERGRHEAAVHDPGPGLVPLAEGHGSLVPLDPLLGRPGKVEAVGVVAAPPARRVVVGGDRGAHARP